MALKEKAKERVENIEKEVKESIGGLRADVAKLSDQVRDKLKGASGEMKETAESLTREIKALSEKVKEMVPKKKKAETAVAIRKESLPSISSDYYQRPLAYFNQRVRRLFDDFYRDFELLERGWQGPSWPLGEFLPQAEYPRIDFVETDETITATAELPGVTREELQVTVSGDILSIKGEKRQEKEEGEGRYHRTECYYGSFQRSFALPCEIDDQKVDASFDNGVLTVTLPKTETAKKKVRHISIK